ncbi:MAG: UbiA-like polyprenyltransferase [Thermodesulfovibrionales bacterium]
MPIQKVSLYLKMIKFSHSIFALPFALTSAIIASKGIPPVKTLFWIIVAMVSARTAAMGLNRVIDMEIDRANPRTAGREIPSGKVRPVEAIIFVAISLALLVLSAYMLNPLCLKLSPLAIAFIILYSYTKRFTWLSHFILGITISAAPVGAWIAVTGALDLRIIPMGIAVVFWLAGFDILYALQDIDFDRSYGLFSIPSRFGIRKSITLSRLCHFIAYLLLMYSGLVLHLSYPYYIGMMITAGLFIYEHSLVKPDDLSKLDMAFFNMNGYISVTVFLFTFLNFIL